MKIKKLLKTILAATMILGMVGCGSRNKEPAEPNANRKTEGYDYDFIDYIDIKAYGPDGKGILEVTPKNYTAADFRSEQEYIAIKKLMDELNLSYIQGVENKKSNIYISNVTNLSNGDVIQVGITEKWKGSTDLNINLNTYDFVVDTLTEGQDIDLFNDESVIVYGLKDTNQVFAQKTPKTATLPKEIEDHIQYQVSTTETNLVENVSIVNITATMDEEFLTNPDNPYYNIDIYLKKHGYDFVSQTQTVVDKVITPLEFTQGIINAIGDYLTVTFVGQPAETWARSFTIDRIGNIQQLKEVSGYDAFQYLVTFHGVSEDGVEGEFLATMYLWEVGGELILTDFSGFTAARVVDIIRENPYNEDYQILGQYFYTEEELAQKQAEEEAKAEGEAEVEGEEATEETPTEQFQRRIDITGSS